MVEFGHEIKNAFVQDQHGNDWVADQARHAYAPGVIPVLDNGSRVSVGGNGDELRIELTPGLLAQIPAALRRGLNPGETLIIPLAPPPPKE